MGFVIFVVESLIIDYCFFLNLLQFSHDSERFKVLLDPDFIKNVLIERYFIALKNINMRINTIPKIKLKTNKKLSNLI